MKTSTLQKKTKTSVNKIKRKRRKPNFGVGGSVLPSNSSKTFSRGDTTKWRANNYTITKTKDGTVPECYPERFPET